MGDADPGRVVQRYLVEFLNRVGPGSADELIADEGLKQRVTAFRAAFPDLRVTPQCLVAEGELVAVHATGGGTHHGIFQGCPPTGREWSATCTAIYRIRDGRIVETWGNWDLLSILEQLGGVERAPTVSA